jgi:hypothetical protein
MLEDGSSAMSERRVSGSVKLHSLLDHCRPLASRTIASRWGNNEPSKGFINASLAIVAAAPLTAAEVLVVTMQSTRRTHTSGQRMMCPSSANISAHGVFDTLIGGEIHSMCRSYARSQSPPCHRT